MAKVRQDAWSHEDDLLLAETVLRHIREGSTQLNAFEEVGDALNRTSAACGFRWNAEVRNKYVHAIDLAKRQRKERKRAQANQLKRKSSRISAPAQQMVPSDSSLVMEPEPVPEPELEDEAVSSPKTKLMPEQVAELGQARTTITLDSVIHYLQSLQQNYVDSNQSKRKVERLEVENNKLQNELNALERELSITKKKLATVEEDYKTFIQIMERARKMTVLEDQGSVKTPTFKMDKNGNLEQLAHGSN